VGKFESQEVTDALIEAALAKENHHGGKALWVPQKALRAIAQLPAPLDSPRAWQLTALLAQKQDQELSALTLLALEKLLPNEASQLKRRTKGNLSQAWIEASRKHL
jgi:hypothetical protein